MRTRTLIVMGLLGVMTACAASPPPPWDPWGGLDQYWKPRGDASNGVQLMARDACEEHADFNTPCPMDEPIDFRAVNRAPEPRCYRWRLVAPEALFNHNNFDSGWKELPPSRPNLHGGTLASIDPYIGTIEWGIFHIGCRCVDSKLIALRVPPQGTCQDYNDAITSDAVTGDWAFNWQRLLEIAGTDAAGRSRLQDLFGDIKSVSIPGRPAVPIEVAAGLVKAANVAMPLTTAGGQTADRAAAANVAKTDASAPAANAAAGMPANYLTLSPNERLTIAAGLGIVSEVRLLLDAGANVNARDATGMTALMRAAEGGHREVVEALLAYGADPTLFAPDFRTAASIAQTAGHVDLVRLLAPRGPVKKP